MAWATAIGAPWGKIEAKYNAEWLKLTYLDGPGYTAWDRIEAKSELHRKFFSRSSSHGVVNSPIETLTQPVESHLTSPMVESNRQHNLRTTGYAQEIRESCARILKLLQEIDATDSELKNDAFQISVETFPSMEPIDASDSLTVALQVSKNFLPSTEPIEEQSIATDSVDARKFMVEVVTPVCEITSNPLVRTPHLNLDVSYSFSSPFCKRIIRPILVLPVDLRSFTVMISLHNKLIVKLSSLFVPPLPKPSNLTHNAIENPPPPPEPPDNVSLLILIVFEVLPSFSTTLNAQKLFDYLPHRNKISWSHTCSMYAQHRFDILGLVLFFHFLRSYGMNPTEFILNHGIKVGIQWGGINHVLHLYYLVVNIVLVTNTLSSGEAYCLCVKMSLTTNFYCDTLKGLLNEMPIHASFVQVDFDTYATVVLLMITLNAKVGVVIVGCHSMESRLAMMWLVNIDVGVISLLDYAITHIPNFGVDDIRVRLMLQKFYPFSCDEESNWIFIEMEKNNVLPGSVIYVMTNIACSKWKEMDEGRYNNKYFIEGISTLNLLMACALIEMVEACGEMNVAHSVFHNMISTNVIMWPSFIGFANFLHITLTQKFFNHKLRRDYKFWAAMFVEGHARVISQNWTVLIVRIQVIRGKNSSHHLPSMFANIILQILSLSNSIYNVKLTKYKKWFHDCIDDVRIDCYNALNKLHVSTGWTILDVPLLKLEVLSQVHFCQDTHCAAIGWDARITLHIYFYKGCDAYDCYYCMQPVAILQNNTFLHGSFHDPQLCRQWEGLDKSEAIWKYGTTTPQYFSNVNKLMVIVSVSIVEGCSLPMLTTKEVNAFI